ncbi:MAG: hypothetical protein JXA78_17270 [Anaerolineales bacterium]|nr:hypothetical protein [Anaerolineales bacterium]
MKKSGGSRYTDWFFFLLALGLLGLILACGSPTTLVTVNLNAERVNQVLQGAVVDGGGAGGRFEMQQAELQDGFLRIYGAYLPQGGQAVAGSFDLALSVQEGILNAQVTAVDIQGGQLEDAWLRQASARLVTDLAAAAAQGRQEAEIVSAKITPQALQIGLRFLP